MNMPAWPLCQPVAYQRRLVGCVIVHDQMDVQIARNSGFDLIEKLTELFGAMAPVTLADDPTGCDIEGGKQRCGAMAFVVVTAALHLARSHGQHRLAAVQRLNLRLLIDAQHDGALGRGHVEADDVANLGNEIGVGRELEGLQPVWLQAEGAPYPLY